MDWIIGNWVGLSAIALAGLRLVESIMVVLKNEKALSIIKIIKEFFKLG